MPTLTLRTVGGGNASPETVAPAGTPAEPIAPLEEIANLPSARLSAALHRARAKAFLTRRRPNRQDAPVTRADGGRLVSMRAQ
jgi:hypothetical protein